MGWFDRNPIFASRRICKNLEARKSGGAGVPALPVKQDWFESYLGNPVLGTSETIAERRAREMAVSFNDGISSQTYGAHTIRKDDSEADESRRFLLRIRGLVI